LTDISLEFCWAKSKCAGLPYLFKLQHTTKVKTLV